MGAIGQYYYKDIKGAGGRVKITPGFESYDRVFCKPGVFPQGETAPPALIYDRSAAFYFVGREERYFDDREKDEITVRHGFLFPLTLFTDHVFGAKLYRFFDIGDFDCTAAGFDQEEMLSAKNKLTVTGDCCDFLRPADVFWQCKETPRFVKLLLYASLMAVTEEFSLIFALPDLNAETYHKTAVSMLKSIFAMIPWELREYLTFHTCVDDQYALGNFKISFTSFPDERLRKSNRSFYFDLKNNKVTPDLVIEQKIRGTVSGDLLYLIWFYRDEKALSALFYIFHHNRGLLGEDAPRMVLIDALSCYFLLTKVGEKYRGLLKEELSRISKGASREILLCLAGHLTDGEFTNLREMLQI
ncbi:MAG TPA: hypothetical protein PKD52_07875 [Clostridiales bacterium]|nr:hypothetical protein [Clostridiales bacterium]